LSYSPYTIAYQHTHPRPDLREWSRWWSTR